MEQNRKEHLFLTKKQQVRMYKIRRLPQINE